jgi:hypothetical protein
VNPDASSLLQAREAITTVHWQANQLIHLLSHLVDTSSRSAQHLHRRRSDEAITCTRLADPCVLAAIHRLSPSVEVSRQPSSRHSNRDLSLFTRHHASASRILSAASYLRSPPTDPSVPSSAPCLPQSRMVNPQKPVPSASSRQHRPTNDP